MSNTWHTVFLTCLILAASAVMGAVALAFLQSWPLAFIAAVCFALGCAEIIRLQGASP